MGMCCRCRSTCDESADERMHEAVQSGEAVPEQAWLILLAFRGQECPRHTSCTTLPAPHLFHVPAADSYHRVYGA